MLGGTNLVKIVAGVDVASMGSRLSDFGYALAILKDGFLTSYDSVSLSRLIRFLWEFKPHIVAVDNIMELGGSKRDLVKILELLPPESRIVQVTLTNGELIDLRRLAREAGISVEQGKLSPRRTAELLAVLASMGYGTELKLFEDKVKVIVSRGRVPGGGGSSANRFKRKVRASLLGAVKELKAKLEKERIDYDVTIRRSEGGVEGALFTVYAPRERLYGIVKPIRSPNIIIRVKPTVHRRVLGLLYSATIPERYLIVGVDPGIETGLAIVDLDLNPLEIISSKTLDRDYIIQTILKHGTPVLIATDKNPAPDTVEKLAATLNIKLYSPSRSLSSTEKETLVGEYISAYRIGVKSTHERDALAACIRAYKEFEEKFIQLEGKLLEIGLSTSRSQKYKAEIINGSTVAEVVEKVINDYLDREESVGQGEGLARVAKLLVSDEGGRKDKRLVNEVERIARERDLLLKRVNELEKQVLELEVQLKLRSEELNMELARDREVAELRHRLENVLDYVRSLEARVSDMLNTLDGLKNNFNLVFRGNHILVRRLRRLCVDEIIKSSEVLGNVKEGEVVFVEEPDVLSSNSKTPTLNLKLKVLTPKQVTMDVTKLYNESGILVGTCRDYVYVNDHLVLIPRDFLEALRKLELELRERLSLNSKLDYEKLLNIINEYRMLRGSSIS